MFYGVIKAVRKGYERAIEQYKFLLPAATGGDIVFGSLASYAFLECRPDYREVFIQSIAQGVGDVIEHATNDRRILPRRHATVNIFHFVLVIGNIFKPYALGVAKYQYVERLGQWL